MYFIQQKFKKLFMIFFIQQKFVKFFLKIFIQQKKLRAEFFLSGKF